MLGALHYVLVGNTWSALLKNEWYHLPTVALECCFTAVIRVVYSLEEKMSTKITISLIIWNRNAHAGKHAKRVEKKLSTASDMKETFCLTSSSTRFTVEITNRCTFCHICFPSWFTESASADPDLSAGMLRHHPKARAYSRCVFLNVRSAYNHYAE